MPGKNSKHEYADRTVNAPAIKIAKLGDGLSKNVPIKPHEFQIGDEVFVALRAVVVSDGWLAVNRKAPEGGDLTPVYGLDATACTIVDKDLIVGMLTDQQERNDEAALAAKRAKESEAGIDPLFDTDINGAEVTEPDEEKPKPKRGGLKSVDGAGA